ncbi:helix-turn-helix domain-containing protein [Sporosarcina sp. FSL K6-2383]|uniref:helix-turn-helix domain-containing protein n=1 Tax=Sporosarcina sp. FSL K6-2383 TaxID=2921556 RepID=UPI00315A00D8
MVKEIGQIIGNIRRSKGYSQEYVSRGILSQGTYSKFENYNIGIRITTFNRILEKLEISPEEFEYIKNGYKYTFREEIINKVFNLSYNNEEILDDILSDTSVYLKGNEDLLIKNLSKICTSLILLSRTSNIEEARIPLKKVWDILSKRNHFYIIDIYLINSILFLFPLETALEIRNFTFRSIERYKNFQDVERLKINISINIMLLLIKEKRFKEAYLESEQIINLCKQHQDYFRLAICYVRKGICMNHIEMSGKEWIQKGKNILTAIEEVAAVKLLEDEIKLYG